MPIAHSLSREASTTSFSSNNNTTSSGSSYNSISTSNIASCGPSTLSQQPLSEMAQQAVKDPQEFFRKSCSMKIAAEEAVEAGDEAEEEEDDAGDDESKENHQKKPRGE